MGRTLTPKVPVSAGQLDELLAHLDLPLLFRFRRLELASGAEAQQPDLEFLEARLDALARDPRRCAVTHSKVGLSNPSGGTGPLPLVTASALE